VPEGEAAAVAVLVECGKTRLTKSRSLRMAFLAGQLLQKGFLIVYWSRKGHRMSRCPRGDKGQVFESIGDIALA